MQYKILLIVVLFGLLKANLYSKQYQNNNLDDEYQYYNDKKLDSNDKKLDDNFKKVNYEDMDKNLDKDLDEVRGLFSLFKRLRSKPENEQNGIGDMADMATNILPCIIKIFTFLASTCVKKLI